MAWKKGQSGNPAGRRKTPEKEAAEAIVRKALAEGTTPLEVLLEAMKEAYEEGGAKAAVPFAKEAAPYMHPRLSTVDANHSGAVGTYEAQPQGIPTEQRHSDALASSAGPAVNGHSARSS